MLTHFQSESFKPSDHFGGPRCRWLNNIKLYAADQVIDINIRPASKRVQDVAPRSVFFMYSILKAQNVAAIWEIPNF
jgi:hypothetical protein